MFQWLKPMWKIISQHFSAEDFETSVNMIKENFKVFLQVISATIIGEKQILKILQDYFYLIIDYVSIKTHDSGSSTMLIALNMLFSNRGCNQFSCSGLRLCCDIFLVNWSCSKILLAVLKMLLQWKVSLPFLFRRWRGFSKTLISFLQTDESLGV